MMLSILPTNSLCDLWLLALLQRQKYCRPQLTGLSERERQFNIGHTSIGVPCHCFELADDVV